MHYMSMMLMLLIYSSSIAYRRSSYHHSHAYSAYRRSLTCTSSIGSGSNDTPNLSSYNSNSNSNSDNIDGKHSKASSKKKYTVQVSDWENVLRNKIAIGSVSDAKYMLHNLNSTILANGRNVVYIITETCRRANSINAIIPLFDSIPLDAFDCTDDDVIPMLSGLNDKNNRYHHVDDAYKIVKYLQSKNVVLSSKVYSILFNIYSRQMDVTMIDLLFTEVCALSSSKLDIDIVLINTIINSYIRCGSIDRAIFVFASMNTRYSYFYRFTSSKSPLKATILSWKAVPNVRTYNILLKAARKLDSIDIYGKEIRDNISRLMQEDAVVGDAITKNTLLDFCRLSNDYDDAEELLNSGVALGVEGYTSIISGYASNGEYDKAIKVLNLMASKRVYPNKFTLSSIMTASMNTASPNMTLPRTLLNEIIGKYSTFLSKADLSALYGSYIIGITSVCSSANTLSDGRKLKYLQEAKSILSAMDSNKLVPDTATLNAYIQALCSYNDDVYIREALLIMKAMMKIGNMVDPYTYSILFTALGRAGYYKASYDLYKSVRIELDVPAVNALLNSFITSMHESMVTVALFYDITNSTGFVPNTRTYTSVYLAILRNIVGGRPAAPSSFVKSNMFADGYSDDTADAATAVSVTVPTAASDDTTPLIGYLNVNERYVVLDRSASIPTNYDRSIRKLRSEYSIDFLLRKLYASMRDKYSIGVDGILLSVLNSIFATQKHANILNPSIFSTETTRLLFEDLVTQGYEPDDLLPILLQCKFSPRQQRELLENPSASSRIRSAATSNKIFRKYGWNKMESGWSSLGF